MSSAQEDRVTLFSAVVILWDTRVHISVPDSGNILAKVERVVDK